MKIGILALQGAVSQHADKLKAIGVSPILVKKQEQLAELSGIIFPGGESTAMLHLLEVNQLWEPLSQFISSHPVLGVCAGSILLAKEVENPEQKSFKVIPLKAIRNAYGRQAESFVGELTPTNYWKDLTKTEGVFIRAPKLIATDSLVKPLFKHIQEPVLFEFNQILAASFHPELSESNLIHQYFTDKCAKRA